MGRWKIGSLTAALGCIALGVILVLIKLDLLDYQAIGYIWPVLLIALGLEMLLRLLSHGEGRSRTSGWAVVLILLLGCFSAGQSVLAGGSFGSFDEWFGRTHQSAVQGTIPVGEQVRKVRISIPVGKVQVTGAEGDTVEYEGRLLAPGSTQAESDKAIQTNWKATTEGDTLILKLSGGKSLLSFITFGFSGSSPYLNVTLPADLAVTVETTDGSMTAASLRSGIDASTSNGRVEMRDIQGGIKVHSSNGKLLLQRVEGGARVSSSNGSITLEDVGGEVYAKSSNGQIVIDSSITGNWECHSSNGAVSMKIPQNTDAVITADTSNGSLKGSVSWNKKDEDEGSATLGGGKYAVDLSTSNGSVTVDTQ